MIINLLHSEMKNYLLIITLSMFQVTTSFAQDAMVKMEKISYKKVGNTELTVDVFYTDLARQKNDNTAIAFFHGGGWVFGAPEEFHEACRRFARQGYVTFSFQYRLSRNEDGTYPHPEITLVESVMDARTAIRWLRENTEKLKINPEKVVVGGQSAGGQLALSTALLDSVNEKSDNLNTSPVPNALLLYSSNVNTLEPWIDMLLGERSNEIWSISPYHNLRKGMPPAIAFHGEEDDQVLPYIVGLFNQKMKELGNYYDLYTYPGRKHYLGEGIEKYSRYFDEEILEQTDAFLEKFGFNVQ
ncbi:MAG: alpha/beta hydrolase [Mariniphaga sp.]|nr:alpha/beta hydrolase [Mariniphaga sp.]